MIVVLTEEQIKLRDNLREKSEYIQKYRIERYELMRQCSEQGHVLRPRNLNILEDLKTDKWASTGVYCEVCSESFGWFCPESPDMKCHYSKSYDQCDYCGMPEERK